MQQPAVKQLEQELGRRQVEYIEESRSSDEDCNIQFIGRFDDEDVVWHAHIMTLRSCAKQRSSVQASVGKNRLRQFIDIRNDGRRHFVEVGLNLDIIDKAAILRTIIMIRQYKRLQAGRHEYGEWIEF